jgi:NAD(P)-dependent dehydrogenase (short-subunit alcohol dehydrogenase family)
VLAQRTGTSYTLIGGVSAVRPMARYSPVGINSAAQLMMARILIDEMKETPVRINQVMFGFIHTRARASYARPEWVTAREVGELVAYVASDEGRMISGILELGDRPPP